MQVLDLKTTGMFRGFKPISLRYMGENGKWNMKGIMTRNDPKNVKGPIEEFEEVAEYNEKARHWQIPAAPKTKKVKAEKAKPKVLKPKK